MASRFPTGDGGDGAGVDSRRLVAVLVVVGVVAGGGVAATTFLGGGGDAPESNAQLDSVPSGVDGLVYVDGKVTSDEFTLNTLDGGLEVGWWFVDNGTAPDISVVLETLDTQNISYENTTVFLQSPAEGPSDYAGSVVNMGPDSEASDMVALLEDEVGADQLQSDTYNGVDIHTLDIVEAAAAADVEGVTDELDVTGLLREFVGVETAAWVATPDENTVILGSEAAARDAIDVYQGEADPVGGDLREAHEAAETGPVEATVSPNIVDEPLIDILGVVSSDAALLLDITNNQPEFLSVTYSVRDREQELLTFDVVATMADASAAGDLLSAMERAADTSTSLEAPSIINDSKAIDRSAAEQNGRFFHIEIPTLPIQAATYVAQFVDAYAPDPGPTELVPGATEEVDLVDGQNGSFAAGLAERSEDWTADEVAAVLDTANVSYNSSTTFTAEDGEYAATYVRLDDTTGEEFIQSNIRGAFQRASGGSDPIGTEPDRENHKGYRHVDVYNVQNTSTEPDLTRVLSGFEADGTEWVVPIGNNSVLFGDIDAVTDAVDIFRGVAAPPGTTPSRFQSRSGETDESPDD